MAFVLKILEKGQDVGGREVGELEGRHRALRACRDKAQKKSPGIAVREHGMA